MQKTIKHRLKFEKLPTGLSCCPVTPVIILRVSQSLYERPKESHSRSMSCPWKSPDSIRSADNRLTKTPAGGLMFHFGMMNVSGKKYRSSSVQAMIHLRRQDL